jgi:hypothetical protein
MPQVEFNVQCETIVGESVMVVGSDEKTGSWNPQNSEIKLCTDAASYPYWAGAADLPERFTLSFKFAVLTDVGTARWEDQIDNRSLQVQDSSVKLVAKFDQPEAMVIRSPNFMVSPSLICFGAPQKLESFAELCTGRWNRLCMARSVSSWDYPLSRAEKVHRLLLLFEAEEDTSIAAASRAQDQCIAASKKIAELESDRVQLRSRIMELEGAADWATAKCVSLLATLLATAGDLDIQDSQSASCCSSLSSESGTLRPGSPTCG